MEGGGPRLPRYLHVWDAGDCWGPAVVYFCASFQVDSMLLVGLDVQPFKEFPLIPVFFVYTYATRSKLLGLPLFVP